VTESTGTLTIEELALREQLRRTFAALQAAAEAGVDIVPLILEEMAGAGVEMPLALQMLAGPAGG
jgi:hypothetical protein